MTTWIAILLLALLASALLAWPLLRARKTASTRLEHDLAIYRAQLEELSQDVDSGTLSDDMAVTAKREIERRILKAADHRESAADPASFQGLKLTSVSILLLMAAGSLALYTQLCRKERLNL